MNPKLLCILIISCSITFSQWIQTGGTPPGAGITDLVISGSNIVVTCASMDFPNGQMGGMRYSTDGGNTWNANFNCYTGRKIVTGQSGSVFASAWRYPNETEALYKSTNNGVNWSSALYYAGTSNNIFSILVKNNNQTVYIGTRNGVLKSTTGGTSFSPINTGIPASSWVRDLKMDSLGNLAAATTKGLFISTNGGTSWTQVTGIPPGDTIVKLQFDYDISPGGRGLLTRLLAGSDDGRVYAALLSGGYQFMVLLAVFGNDEISDIAIKYLEELLYKIYVVATFPRDTESSGFNMSTDNGTTWKSHNTGLPANPRISAVTTRFSGSNLRYTAGLYENMSNGGKVYRFDTPIGIRPVSTEIPEKFSLSQNYPNPFNPTTDLRFEISELRSVRIAVFDALGREVDVIVNQQLLPGIYEVTFDAYDLPSGIYYYRLFAGDFAETKKMMLVK